jgi:L,D-transpeptidase catalytic domain
MSTSGTRPRYGRIAAFGASVVITATALLSGVGVLPSGGTPSYAAARHGAEVSSEDSAAASLTAAEQREPLAESTEAVEDTPVEVDPVELLVPEDSGEGRRVVFDQSAQRVWLVKKDGSVERTYLVSGSVEDNLDPGTYSVFSRDKEAWGIDGSDLRFMVRFTTGTEAAIGFHNIPVLEGEKVQTRDELGVPRSHGCIRQWSGDAKALWEFAPLGTTVVVVA